MNETEQRLKLIHGLSSYELKFILLFNNAVCNSTLVVMINE